MMPSQNKEGLRSRMRNVRASMNVEEWEASSRAIAESALSLPEIGGASSLMLYLPMAGRREVDTGPLARMIGARKGVSLFAPSCDGADLCAVPYRDGDPVCKGAFGQPEPLGECVEAAPDVLIVPVVAADTGGNRLGYGKGYYDRFIAGLRRGGRGPFVVALAFAFQLVDALPRDPWDERVDCIVTEKKVVRIR